MQTAQNRYILIAIILIGAIIRIALIHFSTDLTSGTDVFKYERIAQNIVSRGAYSFSELNQKNVEPTIMYPPVYPLLLAGIYRIFGYNLKLINYLHIILYLIACIVIFMLASILYNRLSGIIAVGFFSIEPVSILYSIIAMPDLLAAILIVLNIYFLVNFFKSIKINKEKYRYLLFSGLALGIAVLTKPVAFYFFIVDFILIFIFGEKSIKKKFIHFLATLITYIFCISPWIIRNYLVYHKICFSSVSDFLLPVKKSELIDNINVRFARNLKVNTFVRNQAIRYFLGTASFRFYEALFDKDMLISELESDKRKKINNYDSRKEYEIRDIPNNVDTYIKFFRFSKKFAVLQTILFGILMLIYCFSILGIIACFRNKKLKEFCVLILPTLYFATMVVVILCNSRYRFPSIPFYSILAGYGFSSLLSWRICKTNKSCRNS